MRFLNDFRAEEFPWEASGVYKRLVKFNKLAQESPVVPGSEVVLSELKYEGRLLQGLEHPLHLGYYHDLPDVISVTYKRPAMHILLQVLADAAVSGDW